MARIGWIAIADRYALVTKEYDGLDLTMKQLSSQSNVAVHQRVSIRLKCGSLRMPF